MPKMNLPKNIVSTKAVDKPGEKFDTKKWTPVS
jgi:hypothetical protein